MTSDSCGGITRIAALLEQSRNDLAADRGASSSALAAAGAAPPGSSGWLGIDWLKVATYAVPAIFVAWYFAVRQRRQRQEKGGGSSGTP